MSQARVETEIVGVGAPTVALSLLSAVRSSTRSLDRLYVTLGFICGFELLFLGFFITYQVIARKLGWVSAPGTDTMSGYILAMAATWSFSYSLRSGSHVRIDVLLPFMGVKTRRLADMLAVMAVGFFGAITAWKMWVTIVSNYQGHVVTNDYPLTPLWIPKLVVGIGFGLLSITDIQMILSMLAEWFLPVLHKKLGGGEVARYDVMVEDVPSIA